MGQRTAYQDLALHRGELLRKPYYWFNVDPTGLPSSGQGRQTIMDVGALTNGTYRGITIEGWMMGGGYNTANSQHKRVDFIAQVRMDANPSYLLWQSASLSYSKLEWWELNANQLNYRLAINHTTASGSFAMEFRLFPLAYWPTEQVGIKLGNPREMSDMTGYTYQSTGI